MTLLVKSVVLWGQCNIAGVSICPCRELFLSICNFGILLRAVNIEAFCKIQNELEEGDVCYSFFTSRVQTFCRRIVRPRTAGENNHLNSKL